MRYTTVLTFYPRRSLLRLHVYDEEGRLVEERSEEGVKLLELEAPIRAGRGLLGSSQVYVAEGRVAVEVRAGVARVRIAKEAGGYDQGPG